MSYRAIKCACSFALVGWMLLLAACGSTPLNGKATFGSTGEGEIIGDVALPPLEQRISEDGTTMALLCTAYRDVTLSQVMAFSDELEAKGWYLHGNSATKGARSVDVAYSTDTQLLDLSFSWEMDAAEWPQDVLTPYLSYVTPPFPYGAYDHGEEVSGGDAIKLVYTGVSSVELQAYLAILENAGFVQAAERVYRCGMSFVQYEFGDGACALTIGLSELQMAPLPPWPDPLPESLKRLLPPIAASITVTETDDGFFAAAGQTSLCDLHGFINAAPRYGWSEMSAQNELVHAESGLKIRIGSYSTDTDMWELTIYNASKAEPTQTKTPNGGEASCGYRVTQGCYGEEQAMMGVLDEFGQFAEMADWNQIKVLYGNDFAAFLDEAGADINEDLWVQLDGNRYYGGSRHYFLAYVNGGTREGFFKHDQVGDVAWLGSWQGIELRVLVKVPSDQLE